MSLSYQWEPLAQLLDDGLERLSRRHYEELIDDQEHLPLATDWRGLEARERRGEYRVATARHRGRLVGYASFVLFRPERYPSVVHIVDDVYYLAPEYRHGLAGYQFLKFAIEGLPKGAKLSINADLAYRLGRQGSLLQRLGMKPVEVVYSKFL